MRSAIRRPEYADRRRINMQARLIDDLPDQTAKVGRFDVHVREIRLSIRIAEAPRRIREEREACIREALRVLIVRSLASSPTMHANDERVRGSCARHPDDDVEHCAVEVAGEIAVARQRLGRRSRWRVASQTGCDDAL